MPTSPNTSKWYDRPWAAFIFFTRLPLWRLHQPPVDAYRSVVEWWPLTGWLTGGVMAAVLYGASFVLPMPVAVLMAIVARLLLTGALHEDGLADFFDGFGGGGTDRDRILAIMKDSHIGTYGVLASCLHGLLYTSLHSPFCPQSCGPHHPCCRPIRQDALGAGHQSPALRTDGRNG